MSLSRQNKKSKYIVSLRTSFLPLPIAPFKHVYLTTAYAGKINRYEVMPTDQPRVVKPLYGKIYKNLLAPEQGFLIINVSEYAEKAKGLRWSTKEYASCSGAAGSPAHRLYAFIEDGGLYAYPHAHTYRMIKGPNSNTFIQWVLDQVPDHGLKMPLNAWGRFYSFFA